MEPGSPPTQPRSDRFPRLAIITTHPIQYYAPWFRYIVAQCELELKVFFLFQPTANRLFDAGFQQEVRWDTPLLDGYASEFVENTSDRPGTGSFGGLRNPKLPDRVRDFGPDAVLMIGYNYLSMVWFVLAQAFTGIPLILRGDSHRLVPDSSIKARIKGVLLAAFMRRFSAFLYVGEANYRYFKLHGASEAAMFRAPHAVDNDRFMRGGSQTHAAARKWRRELGIEDERLVVLFAGKFESKKRPLDLLRAFQGCEKGGAALLFVGSGELESQLREEASGDIDVFFAPFQNQSQMPRTYAACDIFVLPSFGPYETWGLAVNEAMCLGRPVIVSSHVGCAEDLVKHGVSGLVFEAGNQDDLRAALNRALSSRTQVAEWGVAARSSIQAFSYAEATNGLLKATAYATAKRSRGDSAP